LLEEHGLSRSLAMALLNDLRLDLYEHLVKNYGSSVPCSVIASIFVNIIPALRREGIPVDDLDESMIENVVKALAEGIIAKEALPDILSYLARTPGTDLAKAVEALGIKYVSMEDLDLSVTKVIEANKEKILARRDKAFSIVMSEVMKTVRGKVDGKLVAERVKAKLREILNIET
ncbi:MAG: Glu-tRNA(Gln) amidotransferase GatDE subunit E, partial [Desulfurococcaceae archaeon]